MAEGRRRGRSLLSVRRWPVRWRLAGVSAGLTLLILVVGQLASDRIKDDFDHELIGTANEVRSQYQLGEAGINAAPGRDLLDLLMAGDAAVRIVDAAGDPIRETDGAPDLGPPNTEDGVKVAFGKSVYSLLI